jgi:hypothetical protein
MDLAAKVALLRELTRGADDVFAVRTDDVWRPLYAALPDQQVRMHLQGLIEIGSYPLMPQGAGLPTLWWIAADFDGKPKLPDPNAPDQRPAQRRPWKPDVVRTVQFLVDTGCPLFVNLSRSAQGAHVRVLFKEPVPAWLARRWFMAWLEEAGVLEERDDGLLPTFDRLIPPQDALSGGVNKNGYRLPGNLIGSPLNGKLALKNGATLPLQVEAVADGRFEPDGQHWAHVQRALNERTWGHAELLAALRDAPGSPATDAPAARARTYLPIAVTDAGTLDFTIGFCEFIKHMRDPRNQSYALWVALASELHRWGDAGRKAWHEISSLDNRYSPSDADRKWDETAQMHPVRCDTLVEMGYRCPHLNTPRCAGAAAPAFFWEHMEVEIR